jgi:hypothetical protein
MLKPLFKSAPVPKTLNVEMHPAPGGAGRDPAATGKEHVSLKLEFDSADEALRRLKEWGVNVTALTGRR